MSCSFFFNDTATTEIYTRSLHDALPIYRLRQAAPSRHAPPDPRRAQPAPPRLRLLLLVRARGGLPRVDGLLHLGVLVDRKSTRLNSSHANISYAVFCLKKKNLSPLSNPY